MTRWIACLAVLALAVPAAMAQGAGASERLRLVQDETRRTLAQKSFLDLPHSDESTTDVGGWATLTLLDLADDDHREAVRDPLRDVLFQDYRLWVEHVMNPEWKGYFRVRHQTTRFSKETGIIVPDTSKPDGFEVDQAYVDWTQKEGNLSARIGRQYVRTGRGLVLSADLDGAGVTWADPEWKHRVLVGHSVDRDANVDTSLVGFDQGTQERTFYLGESTWHSTSGDEVYGFGLVQHDESRSRDATQSALDFHYQSWYLGLGAQGRFKPQLHYYGELVYQGGSSLAVGAPAQRVDIDAQAVQAGLLYYPDSVHRPQVSLEVAHGSGDSQRASVTNTFGGKLRPTTDQNFIYFGAYDGGLALSPRLSNLDVLRVGYQLHPLDRRPGDVPDLVLGTKFSLYWKDELDGIISDPLAVRRSDSVGTGFDFYAAVRPFTDLSVLIQYGRFSPGSAFLDGVNDPSDRLLVSTSLSF